jgi:hypothetical protein
MGKVKDNQPMVVLGFARNTNAITSTPGSDVRVINPHGNHTVVYIEETLGLSSILINVVDISAGWISFLFFNQYQIWVGIEAKRGHTVSKLNILAKLLPE